MKHPFISLRVYHYWASVVRPSMNVARDGTEWHPVRLNLLRKGAEFKRKPDSLGTLTKAHYNRKDYFGPASYCCLKDSDPWGSGVAVRGNAMVWIDEDHRDQDCLKSGEVVSLTAAQSKRTKKNWVTA
tara:strand:+ start:133 stop:516 length:384 start_codon:yes stop_codon:yes gene_type:complete